MDVIVYESQSKFKQSNLGVSSDENSNIGGSTRIVGSKIFMYFEGDHQKFNQILVLFIVSFSVSIGVIKNTWIDNCLNFN